MDAIQNRENFLMAVSLKLLHLSMWDLHLNICFKGQQIHLTYLRKRIIDRDWLIKDGRHFVYARLPYLIEYGTFTIMLL